MFACRQGRCRRHLRLGRAALISRGRAVAVYYFPGRGTSYRPNTQLPLPIPSSAASACEQAFSRELLLGLTRDTVLAAVPWLKFLAESATALDLTIPQAMNRSRPIGRTTIRYRPFVRLTSFGGGARPRRAMRPCRRPHTKPTAP